MLRAADYKDNDKILTLLTAERGRISAGLKGVKKAGAKLKFAAQPFCFAEYILAPTGDKYTVIQASECESFFELRSDINKYYAACAVCETALALTYEGDIEGELFSNCIKALSAMCDGDETDALISFLISAMDSAGYKISLGGCGACGSALRGERIKFDMDGGAFLCPTCGNGVPASYITYSLLRSLKNGTPPDIPSDMLPVARKKALRLLREYLAYKTDARLLSLSEYIRMI